MTEIGEHAFYAHVARSLGQAGVLPDDDFTELDSLERYQVLLALEDLLGYEIEDLYAPPLRRFEDLRRYFMELHGRGSGR